MIYCKACKWRVWGEPTFCYPKDFPEQESSYFRPKPTPNAQFMKDLNKTNSCLYYHRRRWMFWVRY